MKKKSIQLATSALILAAGCGGPAIPIDDTFRVPAGLSARAQLPEGPADEYVTSPVGRFHRSCVHSVPSGAFIDANDNVIVDGRIVDHHEPCRYRWHRSGDEGAAGAGPVPTIDGWVESARTVAFTNGWGFNWFNDIVGSTIVPRAPRTSASQVVFFFTSLEPLDRSAVIQPVIQWGVSAGGGGAFWSAAVWYVNTSGVMSHSILQPVSSGETILGSLQAVSNSCTNAGVCTWQMAMLANGTLLTVLNVATTEIFNTAQKAVLEAHSLTACSQYPNQANVTYTNVHVFMPGPQTNTHNDITAALGWAADVKGGTPDCSYQVVMPNPNVGAVAFDGQHG
jgi:hypothetical protein